MKRLLSAVAVAAILGAAVPSRAGHYAYDGGCSFSTSNDTTPGRQLGGPEQWNGTIEIFLVAHADGMPIGPVFVECTLKINNSAGTVVASASGLAGGPVVVYVSQFTYTADEDDVVTLCTSVTIGHENFPPECGDAPAPQPATGAVPAPPAP